MSTSNKAVGEVSYRSFELWAPPSFNLASLIQLKYTDGLPGSRVPYSQSASRPYQYARKPAYKPSPAHELWKLKTP
jgi:hypothetical protein